MNGYTPFLIRFRTSIPPHGESPPILTLTLIEKTLLFDVQNIRQAVLCVKENGRTRFIAQRVILHLLGRQGCVDNRKQYLLTNYGVSDGLPKGKNPKINVP